MRPLIGVTPSVAKDKSRYTLHGAHGEAIERAGGIPIMIPYVSEAIVQQLAQKIDGLYLTGGYDIDPHYFNEEPEIGLGRVDPLRDLFEIKLLQEMLMYKKPVFGVCRGSQIINVALGGTMYQDLEEQKKDVFIQHKQKRQLVYGSHYIKISQDSLLYKMIQSERIKVNSNHHQANKQLGSGLQIAATSKDGVIEAIEGKNHPFLLGVQWHPERLLQQDDTASYALYTHFIKAVIQQKETK